LKFTFKRHDTAQNQEDRNQYQTADDNRKVRQGLVIDTCPLNSEQREGVDSLLTEDNSIVTGPPDTVKSQVVSATMMNARPLD